MHLVEKVLGNREDAQWATRLAGVQIDILDLDQWDAQKNRLRKATRGGQAVAISLERDAFLRDGDVLLWDEAASCAVVCAIALCDVLVIELEGLASLAPATLVERCVQLGHALGNQHWPAVVREGRVYVPVSVERKVVNSVMRTHHFAGVAFTFVPGAELIGTLSPGEARRLFGGGEMPIHSHGQGHDHPHEHGAGHEHSHTHGEKDGQADGHSHGHEHTHGHKHEHGQKHEHGHKHEHHA